MRIVSCSNCKREVPAGAPVYVEPGWNFGFPKCRDCAALSYAGHGLVAYDEPEKCACCERPVVPQRRGRHRGSNQFCSTACASAFYAGRKAVPEPRACAYCEEVFTPKRSDARFCSTKCRVYANRKVHA
jgi:hypothetical protein